ncbi:PorP/SprF family type IX secretion system membrane protein [Pontibacter oryzae]|uniref:Type IX secretion system membrane protein PorP/SprF n=1 Tax=Pontibacter oryzae TaxID=2304593 RepID=A0A399RVL6_9BACT|nr:type IX secretion system membrane protein PorP/SprF [Pontibacter oryzae]RIJ34374.1 type IX secretion system membrane protein PorP/SprF [Pontibacter oryzae]
MKKAILFACCMMLIWAAQAQNRKYMANFSQFRQYYNPALTGADGSAVKSLYRNQWTGFKDAPKTILATAELDMDMLGHKKSGYFRGQGQRSEPPKFGAKHALGLTLLHDQFGPARELQVGLSYGSAIRISEALSLRWGTALTYTAHSLDGNSLTLEEENDPRFSNILGQQNRSGKGDINLGLTLTSENYYIGYAMKDATAGKLLSTGDDYLADFETRKQIVTAGYRADISKNIGFAINALFQHDGKEKALLEGQAKTIYNNMLWVGAGYRNDKAYHVSAGLQLDRFAVGYTYETSSQGSESINKATNEITLGYLLQRGKSDHQQKPTKIW